MRARYQSKPRVAAFGIMLSLGLIFGAHEVMQAAQLAESEEAASVEADLVMPMGAATLDLSPEGDTEADRANAPLDRSC